MAKILVIGDSCIDRFVYCESTRLAPDVPVPVLKAITTKQNPGMAANVQRNILALDHECDIITQSFWMNVTKTRYVHQSSNHTFIRVDDGYIDRFIFPSDWESDFLQYDVIAISDYDKGFLWYEDIERIANSHPCVFLDTKKPLTEAFENCTFIKINTPEYHASEKYLNANFHMWMKTIHTAGDKGAYFRGSRYDAHKVAVSDVSGAGDTFFAALVCEYTRKKNIEDSIIFANKCASLVVQQRGVTVIPSVR